MARDLGQPRHKLQSFRQGGGGWGCFTACLKATGMRCLGIEQRGMHKNIVTVFQW